MVLSSEQLEEELMRLKNVREDGAKEIRMLERDLQMSQMRFKRRGMRGGFRGGGRMGGGSGDRGRDRDSRRDRGPDEFGRSKDRQDRPPTRGRFGGPRNFYGLAKSGPAAGATGGGSYNYAPPPAVLSTLTANPDKGGEKGSDDESGRRSRKRRRSEERSPPRPKDPETRRRLLKATKKMAKRDPTIAKRNRRMFGGLLSHLKRAAKDTKPNTEITNKAEELLNSQRDSVQQFAETNLMERIRDKRVEKNDQDEILNWKMFKVSSAILTNKMKGHFEGLSKFLWTKTGTAPICWLPADGNVNAFGDPDHEQLDAKLSGILKEIEESIPPAPEGAIEPKEEEDKKDLPKDFDEDQEDRSRENSAEATKKEDDKNSAEEDSSDDDISGRED